MLFFSALGYHSSRLLTFCHDGRNLPKLNSPFLIPLIGLYNLASVAQYGVLFPGHRVAAVLIDNLFFLAILYGFARVLRKPAIFAGYLILAIGANLMVAGIGSLVLAGQDLRLLWLLGEAWCAASFGILFIRSPKDAK